MIGRRENYGSNMTKNNLKQLFARIPFGQYLLDRRKCHNWPQRFLGGEGRSFHKEYARFIRRAKNVSQLPNEDGAWYMARPLVWAHAAGAGQIINANTKEAIDLSIRRGFNVIEVDVSITSDGVPVLSHNFCPNDEVMFKALPSFKEFYEKRVCGRYTPLSLCDLWDKYSNWNGFFALDQSRTCCRPQFNLLEYLTREAPESFLKRIIFLACKFDEIYELMDNNPFSALHFCLFSPPPLALLDSLVAMFVAADVHSVSFADTKIDSSVVEVVKAFSNANIYVSVSGVDTVERFREWYNIGVKCINSNYLLPMDLLQIEGE